MPSSLSPAIEDRKLIASAASVSEAHSESVRLERAVWFFVGLGILLRVVRYAMEYPLWWDEAFVAVNFIRRDYVGLLRPLDYGQVCPVLFLWAELAVVRLLGFSEWSLRLFPLVCGVASVPVFRYAVGRVVRGVPLLLAVAVFAVSYHPIRHAADVKPYASDLLSAVVVLAAGFDWHRSPGRVGRLWTLAVFAPVVLVLSHPAVFVVGGVILGLAPDVIRTGRRPVWIAYATLIVMTTGSFLVLYVAFTRRQAEATLAPMQVQWMAGFPPLHDVRALARWFVTVHTGGMFAYPCGGENGASSLTVLLFLAGAVVLWRRRRRVALLTCLAPFVLALAAAAIRRYPYGGVTDGSPARVMQYLVPGICLLVGVGCAAMLGRIRDPRRRLRALRAGLLVLAGIGIGPVAAEARHPYRTIHSKKAREFARHFWPELARDAIPICLRWDLDLPEWNSVNLNVAVYLCNQMIYSPHRQNPSERAVPTVAEDRPLRCILSLCEPDEPRIAGWLEGMRRSYQLRTCRTVVVAMDESEANPRTERYVVFDFESKPVHR
jgi:hypothetical protein